MDDWASVTRASHTPTCEQRRTGPPLAARLGRAPPSAAAAASTRDTVRTREVQARHGAAGTWRGDGDFYVTLALRGAARGRGALLRATWNTGPAALLSSLRTCFRWWTPRRATLRERRRAVGPPGGRGVGRHGPSLVTREGGQASEGS